MAEDLANAIVMAAHKLQETETDSVKLACITCCAHTSPCPYGRSCADLQSLCFRLEGCGLSSSTHSNFGDALSVAHTGGFTMRRPDVEKLVSKLYGNKSRKVALVLAKPLTLSEDSSSKSQGNMNLCDSIISIARLLPLKCESSEFLAITVSNSQFSLTPTGGGGPTITFRQLHEATSKAKELGYHLRESGVEKFFSGLALNDGHVIIHIFSKSL